MAFATRDEADILREKLEHHLALGFSHFHIIDHGSQDATSEILQEFAQRGVLTYWRMPRSEAVRPHWLPDLVRAARERNPEAWLLVSDTDEFLEVPGGRVASLLSGRQAIRIPRFNCFLDERSERWPKVLGMARFRNVVVRGADRGPVWAALTAGEPPEQVWEQLAWPVQFQDLSENPKVLVPLPEIESLTAGAHAVERWRSGVPKTETTADHRPAPSRVAPVRIRHFPIRSLRGLEARAEGYELLFRNNPELPPTWGWASRYVLYMAERGRLDEVYRSHILSARANESPSPGVLVERITTVSIVRHLARNSRRRITNKAFFFGRGSFRR